MLIFGLRVGLHGLIARLVCYLRVFAFLFDAIIHSLFVITLLFVVRVWVWVLLGFALVEFIECLLCLLLLVLLPLLFTGWFLFGGCLGCFCVV